MAVGCVRCGLCCATAPCGIISLEEDDGVCRYLRRDGNRTACQYMVDNKLTPRDLHMDGGCMIRANTYVWKVHLEMYGSRLKNLPLLIKGN